VLTSFRFVSSLRSSLNDRKRLIPRYSAATGHPHRSLSERSETKRYVRAFAMRSARGFSFGSSA
jgi:hypothetical protein